MKVPIVFYFLTASFFVTPTNAQNSGKGTLPSMPLGSDVEEAWVRHYASNLHPSKETATAIAIDSLGNIYVTGSTQTSPSGWDYYTAKYDSSGSIVWTVQYNGEVDGDDFASAIHADISGNIYVTGRSWGLDNNYDYVTIKYSSSGKEQWVARYNGPGNGDDSAVDLAVDYSENVYVTGYSWNQHTSYDYSTIKYLPSGDEEWIAHYNGSANKDDLATVLTLDKVGNVYVTGKAFQVRNRITESPSFDYTTLKYKPTGTLEWLALYNGLGNGTDEPSALQVDELQNVYVTGWSWSGTNYDYATVKFSFSGSRVWVARYDGSGKSHDQARDLAINDSGYVYVTGESRGSGTDYDYATIKYSVSGHEEWVARYNGPGNQSDRSLDITLDNSGGIYVTGASHAHSTSNDYATIRYAPSGREVWVVRYNSIENNSAIPVGLVMDISGNIYVTGTSGVSYAYGNTDYATVKYTPSGQEEWVTLSTGPGSSRDYGYTLTVDHEGNVYVTGGSLDSSIASDYTTIKYSSSGQEEWVARYNGPGNSEDYVWDLVVDGLGNVYVTGESSGDGTSSDYATIKYSASGQEEWVARYNGSASGYDQAWSLEVDDSGNVYVTGDSPGVGTWADYATVKYNASGVQEWASRYSSPGYAFDGAFALALDDSGNVYVTGESRGQGGAGTHFDITTIKYSTSGTERWIASYNGPSNALDRAYALVIDNSGNVCVTGVSWGSRTDYDYVTIKYSPYGVEEWTARYNGPGNGDDGATSIITDGSGNIYITGRSWSGTDYDFATVKYNPYGAEEWVARYSGPVASDNSARTLTIDDQGNVYVTGTSERDDWNVYTTIKYAQTGISAGENAPKQQHIHLLLEGSPNPAHSLATIRFLLPQREPVTLTVFDVSGRKVKTLLQESLDAGHHQVTWDAKGNTSGVYFYRLEAGLFQATEKLILLK